MTGFMMGISLIVAIGPQNAFVLRQGVLKQYIPLIVFICIASDVVLMSAGTAGMGALVQSQPKLLVLIKYLGAAYLLYFALTCAHDALKPKALIASQDGTTSSWTKTAVTCLAFTWLNPATYIDTLLFIGGIANQHADQKWWFNGGAILASIVWFIAIGFGAAKLSPILARPTSWRILNLLITLMMCYLAVRMLTM